MVIWLKAAILWIIGISMCVYCLGKLFWTISLFSVAPSICYICPIQLFHEWALVYIDLMHLFLLVCSHSWIFLGNFNVYSHDSCMTYMALIGHFITENWNLGPRIAVYRFKYSISLKQFKQLTVYGIFTTNSYDS